MASDLEASLDFCRRWFDALVVDFKHAGARNVFVAVGSDRLHFLRPAATLNERNALNHIGLVVEDLDELAEAMTAKRRAPPKACSASPAATT